MQRHFGVHSTVKLPQDSCFAQALLIRSLHQLHRRPSTLTSSWYQQSYGTDLDGVSICDITWRQYCSAKLPKVT